MPFERTVLPILAFSLLATSASALQIDPRCRNMRDKIGCTCAVQNGGDIRPDKKGWYSSRRSTISGGTNEAFVRCSLKAKGANP